MWTPVNKQAEIWGSAEAYRAGDAFDLNVFDSNAFDTTPTWLTVTKQNEVWTAS